MRSHLLPTALYLARAAVATFGDYLYFDGFGTEIEKLSYSLTAPSISSGYDTSDSSLWLSIWLGVSADGGSWVVQPLLNWCAQNEVCGCDASESQWCVAANTFNGEDQSGQAYITVPTGANLYFESMILPISGVALGRGWESIKSCADRILPVAVDSGAINQKVWLNGDLVSQQTDSEFKPTTRRASMMPVSPFFDGAKIPYLTHVSSVLPTVSGSIPNVITGANECSSSGCGTMEAYSTLTTQLRKGSESRGDVYTQLTWFTPGWTNMTITFAAAVEDLSTYFWAIDCTASGYSSSDGGKVWTVQEINFAQDNFWD